MFEKSERLHMQCAIGLSLILAHVAAKGIPETTAEKAELLNDAQGFAEDIITAGEKLNPELGE